MTLLVIYLVYPAFIVVHHLDYYEVIESRPDADKVTG